MAGESQAYTVMATICIWGKEILLVNTGNMSLILRPSFHSPKPSSLGVTPMAIRYNPSVPVYHCVLSQQGMRFSTLPSCVTIRNEKFYLDNSFNISMYCISHKA